MWAELNILQANINHKHWSNDGKTCQASLSQGFSYVLQEMLNSNWKRHDNWCMKVFKSYHPDQSMINRRCHKNIGWCRPKVRGGCKWVQQPRHVWMDSSFDK